MLVLSGITCIFMHRCTYNAHCPFSQAQGWTPLMNAAYNGHVNVVRALVENTADVHITGKV